MKFKCLESTWPELSKNTFFIYFGQVFQKLWQYKCNLTTFGMSSYQIWPCHVIQAKNLSFPYIKSYCPLNFRKSHQILWFCCIPNGSYKEDNLKEGRICPPPIWNRVKKEQLIGHCYSMFTFYLKKIMNLSTVPNDIRIENFLDIFQTSQS